MSKRWRWIAFGVAVGTLVIAERLRPLRAQKEPGVRRVGRNLAIGLLAGITTAASDAPVVERASRLADRRHLGVLRLVPMPRALRAVLGFLLLDYTLFIWHWLNHRAPFLWRFHAVHHVDLDLDSSTGIRFHFGELFLAAFFRAMQIIVIGVDRSTFTVWQRLLVGSVIFHHSNLELPTTIEGRIVGLVVTPRMHGIHHSTRVEETNTNFSSLLSCWDRLHRSLKLDVPQRAITIGVAGYDDPKQVTLRRSLLLPFAEGRLPAGNGGDGGNGIPLPRSSVLPSTAVRRPRGTLRAR